MTIFGAKDVAVALGVSKAAVSNWLYRYNDTPKPDFSTVDGRYFWKSLDAWIEWHATHMT